MHVFVTGEVGIGKSTVLAKAAARLCVAARGFQTYFGMDRSAPDKTLYIGPAGEERLCCEERAVVRFAAGRPHPMPERFNCLGVQLLEQAQGAPLLWMDECGRLERDASLFQRKVLSALDGETPVLGVVRLDAGGWTQRILSHPKVALLTVTRENRDRMPEMVADLLAGPVRAAMRRRAT